jgi:hypothetical protein
MLERQTAASSHLQTIRIAASGKEMSGGIHLPGNPAGIKLTAL